MAALVAIILSLFFPNQYLDPCLFVFSISEMQISYLLSNGRISNGSLQTIGQIAGPLNNPHEPKNKITKTNYNQKSNGIHIDLFSQADENDTIITIGREQ